MKDNLGICMSIVLVTGCEICLDNINANYFM